MTTIIKKLASLNGMGPEKEIVELWLNRKGFFTIKDINAGTRVIDILAIKQDSQPKVAHVEIACYVSGSINAKKDELFQKFNSNSVTKKIKQAIKEHLGEEREYEKFLITTVPGIKLEGINIIEFDKVMYESLNQLDRQFYSNGVTRTLQLVKYVLLANPRYTAKIIGNEEKYKSLTQQSREEFIKNLFEQDVAKKIFGKRANEELMISLLQESTLKSPERLAAAVNKILTKRTANQFLNTLLKQQNLKVAVKPQIKKNKTLQQFVEN